MNYFIYAVDKYMYTYMYENCSVWDYLSGKGLFLEKQILSSYMYVYMYIMIKFFYNTIQRANSRLIMHFKPLIVTNNGVRKLWQNFTFHKCLKIQKYSGKI